MGAHTLGKLVPEHTGGFNGFWTPGKEDVFNTTYYKNMINPKLYYVNVVSNFFKRNLSRILSSTLLVMPDF
jgi:hypothetical protein